VSIKTKNGLPGCWQKGKVRVQLGRSKRVRKTAKCRKKWSETEAKSI